MKTRTCNICRATKPILEFGALPNGGTDSMCPTCRTKQGPAGYRYVKCDYCGIRVLISRKQYKYKHQNGDRIVCGKCPACRWGKRALGTMYMAGGRPWDYIDHKSIAAKTCKHCKSTKPLSEYIVDEWAFLGYSARCRTCTKAQYVTNYSCQKCGKECAAADRRGKLISKQLCYDCYLDERGYIGKAARAANAEKWYRKQREWQDAVCLAFARDEFKCVRCGLRRPLVGHNIRPHAIFPDLKYDINNIVSLCDMCRKTINRMERTIISSGSGVTHDWASIWR